jgi:hypothetical protein
MSKQEGEMIVKATPPAMAAFSIDPRMVYRLRFN